MMVSGFFFVFWIARVGDGVSVVERGMLVMGMAMIGIDLDSHGCQAGWFYGCHIYFYCIVCVLCLPPKMDAASFSRKLIHSSLQRLTFLDLETRTLVDH